MIELKIVAKIITKPAHKQEVLNALYEVADETRKEVGNVSYELHEDVKDEFKFVLIEVWKSQEAIDAHNTSVHFDNFKNAIFGKIEDLSVEIIQKIY